MRTYLSGIAIIAPTACSLAQGQEARAVSPRDWELKGVIISVDASAGELSVRHRPTEQVIKLRGADKAHVSIWRQVDLDEFPEGQPLIGWGRIDEKKKGVQFRNFSRPRRKPNSEDRDQWQFFDGPTPAAASLGREQGSDQPRRQIRTDAARRTVGLEIKSSARLPTVCIPLRAGHRGGASARSGDRATIPLRKSWRGWRVAKR